MHSVLEQVQTGGFWMKSRTKKVTKELTIEEHAKRLLQALQTCGKDGGDVRDRETVRSYELRGKIAIWSTPKKCDYLFRHRSGSPCFYLEGEGQVVFRHRSFALKCRELIAYWNPYSKPEDIHVLQVIA